MSNWWAEKVGRVAPPTPPAPPPVPQRVPQNLLPPGIGTDPSRAVDHYLQHQQQQAPAEQVQVQQGGNEHYEGELNFNQNLLNAKTKAGNETCPECGSPRYMTPRTGSVMTTSGKVSPRAHCMDCGYTNDPSMDKQGTLAYSAKPIGSVVPARGSSPDGTWGGGFSAPTKLN